MADAEKFESFSVGVKPETNDLRREVFDGIAILSGHENRLRNHCECFERLIVAAHELMLNDPLQFSMFLGEGEPQHGRRFLSFVKRLKGLDK